MYYPIRSSIKLPFLIVFLCCALFTTQAISANPEQIDKYGINSYGEGKQQFEDALMAANDFLRKHPCLNKDDFGGQADMVNYLKSVQAALDNTIYGAYHSSILAMLWPTDILNDKEKASFLKWEVSLANLIDQVEKLQACRQEDEPGYQPPPVTPGWAKGWHNTAYRECDEALALAGKQPAFCYKTAEEGDALKEAITLTEKAIKDMSIVVKNVKDGNDFGSFDAPHRLKMLEEALVKLKRVEPCTPPPSSLPAPLPLEEGTDVPKVDGSLGGNVEEYMMKTPADGGNAFAGAFVGAQFEGSSVSVTTNEYNADSGMRTNQFKDSSAGFMGGVNAGYNWALSPQSFAGVVAEVNGGNSTVSHTFSGSPSFISSDANFQPKLLGRVGYLATPVDAVYLEGGAVFTNQNLKMNLGGVTTDTNQFTFGGAVGIGVEHKFGMASGLLKGARPSLFVEYQHIWAGEANLGQPSASPYYNYSWHPQSDTATAGVRIGF